MKPYSMPMAVILAVNEICDVIRTSVSESPKLSSDPGYGDTVMW